MGCCLQAKIKEEYLGDAPNYELNITVNSSTDNNYGLFDYLGNPEEDSRFFSISKFKIRQN